MLPIADTASFYHLVQQNNLATKVDQWGSMASCDQYRLAYEKTAGVLRPGLRCLDWGCGNGHFSFFLTQNGLRTDAYSFQDPPEFLASNPLCTHTRGDSSNPVALPYPAESFDVVFSVGVLEHVHESGGDPAKSIRELERVLKKNGYFFIFHLPNTYTWIEFLVRRLNRARGITRHEHTRLFTRKSFSQLLEGTSLEILEGERYNFLPRNSFNRLPGNLANQSAVCSAIDLLDHSFTTVCPVLCQNWYFILRKKP